MDLKAWTEAQQAVIGSLLLAPEIAAGEVFQTAKSAHFGDPALRHVFEAARKVWTENRPIDPVTVLAEAGGDYRELIRKAMEMTPTAVNVSGWLDVCASNARVAAMQKEALAIINAADEAEAAAAWERMGLSLQETDDGEDLSVTELIGDYLDRMTDKRPVSYLRWGIEKLDEVLWVSPGQFGVIAADSSVGKTALALQFAWHIASTGKRVGFFSLETPKENLEDRLLAEKQVAGIPLPMTKRKQLTDEEFRRAGEAGARSDRVPLRILRNYDSLERIRAKTVQRKFDVVFIDYVQLIDAPGTERWDIVTRVSMGLHRMAQQLGVTVIGLSQVTPAAKGQTRPTKDDLRESRQLKQDADFILILYPDPEEDAPPNSRILEIAKNKDGRLGRLPLNFEPEHMSFHYRLTVGEMRSIGNAIRNQKAPARADKPKESAADTVEQMDLLPKKMKPGTLIELPDNGEDGELPF